MSSPPFWCLQGGSLRDLLDYQQRHPMERMYDYIDVLQWLLEVARGLRYLHSRSLTHRSDATNLCAAGFMCNAAAFRLW